MSRCLAFITIAALLGAACSKTGQAEKDAGRPDPVASAKPVPADAEAVGLQVPRIAYGATPEGMEAVSATRPREIEVKNPKGWEQGPYRMIFSEDRWKKLWEDIAPGATPPTVDFSRNNVLVVRHRGGTPAPKPWVVSRDGRMRVVLDPATLVSSSDPAAEVAWFEIPTNEGSIASVSVQAPAP